MREYEEKRFPENNPIDESPTQYSDYERHCQQIQAPRGFDVVEGRTFENHHFAYFSLLQEKLLHLNYPPCRFPHPINSKEIIFRQFTLPIMERKFLWTGTELFLLSTTQVATGAHSLFSRASSVPQRPDTPLVFYAIIYPKEDVLEYSTCLDYTSSAKYYEELYPYTQPKIIKFHATSSICAENIKFTSPHEVTALITNSTSNWDTLRQFLALQYTLEQERFIALMGGFLCIFILKSINKVHCDLSHANIVTGTHGLIPMFIDLGQMEELDEHQEFKTTQQLSSYQDPINTNLDCCIYSPKTDLYSFVAEFLHRATRNIDIRESLNLMGTRTYRKDTRFWRKKENYSFLFRNEISNTHLPSTYSSLQPYMIGFMRPHNLERPTVEDLFSDPFISNTIAEFASIIVNSYPDDFDDEIMLQQHLDDIREFDEFEFPTTKSLMLMLIISLHCNKLEYDVRLHHKTAVENIIEETSTSFFCFNILNYYGDIFPREFTEFTMRRILEEDAILEVAQDAFADETLLEIGALKLYDEIKCIAPCQIGTDHIDPEVTLRPTSDELWTEIEMQASDVDTLRRIQQETAHNRPTDIQHHTITLIAQLYTILSDFIQPTSQTIPPAKFLFYKPSTSDTIAEFVRIITKYHPNDFDDQIQFKNTLFKIKTLNKRRDPITRSLMLLLAITLHCNKLAFNIRLHHKYTIESLIPDISFSYFYFRIFAHYETIFPGKYTESTISCFLLDEIIQELVLETTAIEAAEQKIMAINAKKLYEEILHTTAQELTLDLIYKEAIDNSASNSTSDDIWKEIISQVIFETTLESITHETASNRLKEIRQGKTLTIVLLYLTVTLLPLVSLAALSKYKSSATPLDSQPSNHYEFTLLIIMIPCLLKIAQTLISRLDDYLLSPTSDWPNLFSTTKQPISPPQSCHQQEDCSLKYYT